ncbi:MAG: TonB-dependent receptor [Acidobacteriota bacterium]
MALRTLAVLLGLLLAAAPVLAVPGQQASAQPSESVQQAQGTQQTQPPPPTKPGEQQTKPGEQEKKIEEPPRYEEQVVVTASKVEQQLINAPATVSVINTQTLASRPAADYAGLFRAVPGVNVSQTSARDINITSRGATSTLSTSQLALIDGRSVYLDFFGFVGWDFLPVNFAEVKQIEIIRGPASAVWGANAMSGVVNIITKSPREMEGTSFTMGFGGFDRKVDGQAEALKQGGLFYVNATHAQAINDRWSFKLTGGVYSQDPFARPVGNIANDFNTPYPAFTNVGTTQPKFDGRVDYDFADGQQRVTVSGGYAGTKGIIHSGIGPFRIEKGSNVSYVRAAYNKGPLRVQFFTNMLDGEAPALLAIGTDGNPITFTFDTKTYDFEVSNITAVGTRHVLSYGGNVRYNKFDLSIARGGDSRSEQGLYLQDEMFLGEKFRWLVGARLDHFDVLENVVVSPRTTFMIKPKSDHTFRVSYNKAYRAPSLVNNYLGANILNQLDLGMLSPALAGRIYTFPISTYGNTNLRENALNAFEVGYSGVIKNRASVSFAWYYNRQNDEIYFTQVGSYSAGNVPPGWPLPPAFLNLLIAANAFGPGLGLPSQFSYLNTGDIRRSGCSSDCGLIETYGVELGLDAALTRHVNFFANYSWQGDPKAKIPESELNLPPNNRFNTGINVDAGRFFGDLSVTYQDNAYWQDVLDSRYAGWTDAFTLVNGSFGVRWADGRLTTAVKGTNLANQEVQQHVFGDVIKRSVVGELKIRF